MFFISTFRIPHSEFEKPWTLNSWSLGFVAIYLKYSKKNKNQHDIVRYSYIIATWRFSQEKKAYTLEDFYSYSPELDQEVAEIFDRLTDAERAGQMIVQAAGVYGKPKKHMLRLIKEKKLGGILLLNFCS